LKNATLIYNPIAGCHPARRAKQIQEIASVLLERSIAAKLAPTPRPGTAGELARRAVEQGDDLVLVCGGDGTLNEVINGMTPSGVPLGILPGGTANIAAKELGLPHDPVRAARELPAWSPRRIALGLATWTLAAEDSGRKPPEPTQSGEKPPLRRYFLSVAGVGFDAYVVHRLSSGFKMSAGILAYVIEAVHQLRRYSFPRFRCVVQDGKPETPHRGVSAPIAPDPELQATFAVVQRTSRYAGWLHLAPSANLFRSGFSACLFKSAHRGRYIVYSAAVLARQHLRLRDVELLEARKVDCAAVEPGARIYFELDGELAGQLPATFEAAPDALTLLAP
jgi:diacylglycerol kinase family enzyme